MMPRTHAAHERLTAEFDARRVLNHKAAIDAWLVRWGEPPCTIEDADYFDESEPYMDARDAAEEIMCDRH